MNDFSHLRLDLPNFNPVAAELHRVNHRWWHTAEGVRLERNKGELLCLVHSELSEALEAALLGCMDDHLPHRRMEEVEMADTVIRIGDYVGAYGLDVDGAWNEIREAANSLIREPDGAETYNSIRVHFHHNTTETVGWIAEIHMHVSRAMEGERKSKMHHVLAHRQAVEVELAIALHKIGKYCNILRLDLNGAIADKVAYNQVRADHTYEARAQAEGKKW